MKLKIDLIPIVSLLIDSSSKEEYYDTFIEKTKEKYDKIVFETRSTISFEDSDSCYIMYQKPLTQENYDITKKNINYLTQSNILEKIKLIEDNLSEYSFLNDLNNDNYTGNISLYKLNKESRFLIKIKDTYYQELDPILSYTYYQELDPVLSYIDQEAEKRNIYDKKNTNNLYLLVALQDEIITFILIDDSTFKKLNLCILSLFNRFSERLNIEIYFNKILIEESLKVEQSIKENVLNGISFPQHIF